ncbi:MAG: hypothetical protein ABIS86_21260 [Streptosporangiaceae bacterium]
MGISTRSATPAATADTGCTCRRARALGIGNGPFAPQDFMKMGVVGPTPDPVTVAVRTDPRVVRAAEEAEECRTIYELARAAHLAALSEHCSAELARRPDSEKVARLGEAEAEAREILGIVHADMIEANRRHHLTTVQVRYQTEGGDQDTGEPDANRQVLLRERIKALRAG